MNNFYGGGFINVLGLYDRLTRKKDKEKYNQLVSRIKYAIIELNNEQKYQKKLEQEYENITNYVFMYFWAPDIEVPSITVIKSFIIQNINKDFRYADLSLAQIYKIKNFFKKNNYKCDNCSAVLDETDAYISSNKSIYCKCKNCKHDNFIGDVESSADKKTFNLYEW